MVDAGGDGFAEDGDGGGAVLRWAEDVRAGELHGSVAHAVDGDGGVREGEGAAEVRLGGQWVLRVGEFEG